MSPSFTSPLSRLTSQTRRSFALHSFHLTRSSDSYAKLEESKPIPPPPASRKKPKSSILMFPRVDTESIPPVFWLGLLVITSVIFVLALACTFRGVQNKTPYFKDTLDEVAQNNPGVILLGENVDVDVDEPSITIRWSIVACGREFVLENSTGIHGSSDCGLPNVPLNIFVDGQTTPSATYDPARIPLDLANGQRRNIQNLVQFDSDHVLDVHRAYLFPFDTYNLASTIRATLATTNESVPIRKVATLDIDSASSFLVHTSDIESYTLLSGNNGGVSVLSRDFDMKVKRPPGAQAYTLFLYAIGWFLTHACIGAVWMASRALRKEDIGSMILYNLAVMAILPQIRNSMPDAPGLDGVLIDSIGYFPQIVISGLCLVVLTIIFISWQLHPRMPPLPPLPQHTHLKMKAPKARPPPIPLPNTPPGDKTMFEYNKFRNTRQLKGEYVFPPLPEDPFDDPTKVPPSPNTHRRFKTTNDVFKIE